MRESKLRPRWLITRDTREKPGFGYTFAPSQWCGGMVVGKLDSGDYCVQGLESKTVIERKESVSELAGNLTDPRFARELERLKSVAYPLVLCHFSLPQLEQYPAGSDIPKSRWAKLRVKGPFLLRLLTETMVAHPHVHWAFVEAADLAYEFARALLKRTAEAAEAAGLTPPEAARVP